MRRGPDGDTLLKWCSDFDARFDTTGVADELLALRDLIASGILDRPSSVEEAAEVLAGHCSLVQSLALDEGRPDREHPRSRKRPTDARTTPRRVSITTEAEDSSSDSDSSEDEGQGVAAPKAKKSNKASTPRRTRRAPHENIGAAAAPSGGHGRTGCCVDSRDNDRARPTRGVGALPPRACSAARRSATFIASAAALSTAGCAGAAAGSSSTLVGDSLR